VFFCKENIKCIRNTNLFFLLGCNCSKASSNKNVLLMSICRHFTHPDCASLVDPLYYVKRVKRFDKKKIKSGIRRPKGHYLHKIRQTGPAQCPIPCGRTIPSYGRLSVLSCFRYRHLYSVFW
jgi:hypothetical protein